MTSIRVRPARPELIAHLALPRDPSGVSLLVPRLPVDEARLTLRNLGREAARRLSAEGRKDAANHVAALVSRVVDDHEVWTAPDVGVSVFCDADEEAVVDAAPPWPRLTIAPRFRIVHLLGARRAPAVSVATLSADVCRLYRSEDGDLREVTGEGVPVQRSDVLRYDDREPQLMSHGSARRGSGRVVASFHGQGDKGAEEDDRRYLRTVVAAFEARLDGEPLVLAGTKEVTAAFRSLAHYPEVLDEEIAGSGERIELDQLAQMVAAVVNRAVAARDKDLVAHLDSLAGSGRVVLDPGETVAAAYDGRVAELVVGGDGELFGEYDAAARRVSGLNESGEGEELLNLAACETLMHRGSVHVVDRAEVPGPWPMAAIIRY